QLEIVLVDNASRDGVVEQVRRAQPDVRVLASATNEGFGRACNRAMASLHGIDHIALINNDAVPDRDWLSPLVGALAEDPMLGAACPKVVLLRRAWGVVVRQDGASPTRLSLSSVTVDGRTTSAVTADERFVVDGDNPPTWVTTRSEASV